jgi:hypothetical protein
MIFYVVAVLTHHSRSTMQLTPRFSSPFPSIFKENEKERNPHNLFPHFQVIVINNNNNNNNNNKLFCLYIVCCNDGDPRSQGRRRREREREEDNYFFPRGSLFCTWLFFS